MSWLNFWRSTCKLFRQKIRGCFHPRPRSGATRSRYAKPTERPLPPPALILMKSFGTPCAHTAITHLVQAGVDLPTVKRISNHKTLAMVERYAHQNGAHIAEAMDKLQARLTQPGCFGT